MDQFSLALKNQFSYDYFISLVKDYTVSYFAS